MPQKGGNKSPQDKSEDLGDEGGQSVEGRNPTTAQNVAVTPSENVTDVVEQGGGPALNENETPVPTRVTSGPGDDGVPPGPDPVSYQVETPEDEDVLPFVPFPRVHSTTSDATAEAMMQHSSFRARQQLESPAPALPDEEYERLTLEGQERAGLTPEPYTTEEQIAHAEQEEIRRTGTARRATFGHNPADYADRPVLRTTPPGERFTAEAWRPGAIEAAPQTIVMAQAPDHRRMLANQAARNAQTVLAFHNSGQRPAVFGSRNDDGSITWLDGNGFTVEAPADFEESADY